MKDGFLLWYEAIGSRGGLMKDEEWYLRNIVLGYKGEAWLLYYLISKLPKHWIIRHNVWIEGPAQIDILIINEAGIFNINAKNYQSHYRYTQNKAYFNGVANRTDIFAHFKTSMEKLELIYNRIGKPGALEGCLAFVNADYSVEIDDSATCKWYRRDQLSNLTSDLLDAAQSVPTGYEVDIQSTYQKLTGYEIDYPHAMPLCDTARYNKLKKGIDCARCQNFDVTFSLKQVHCPCGHIEFKTDAVARVICQYGMIFHDRELRLIDVAGFFGGQVKSRYISEILTRKFELISLGRKAAYRNPRQPYKGKGESGEVERNDHLMMM